MAFTRHLSGRPVNADPFNPAESGHRILTRSPRKLPGQPRRIRETGLVNHNSFRRRFLPRLTRFGLSTGQGNDHFLLLAAAANDFVGIAHFPRQVLPAQAPRRQEHQQNRSDLEKPADGIRHQRNRGHHVSQTIEQNDATDEAEPRIKLRPIFDEMRIDDADENEPDEGCSDAIHIRMRISNPPRSAYSTQTAKRRRKVRHR